MKKVVVIGGGTGLSTLLRGLRSYPIELSAIVAMTDNGASSGKLRKLNGALPPGDIRKCIAALSEDETGLTELFEYRYKSGFGLRGHSVGNLMIAAMLEKTGSFELAVEKISDILNIRGQVLPSTLQDVHLSASFDDGNTVTGEVKLRQYGYKHKIKKLSLTDHAKTNPRAIKAIIESDVIFIGPGSLYSSIIPSFLQPSLAKAVRESAALRVYVSNVSTEKGETEGFDYDEHLRILRKYKVSYDAVLLNNVWAKTGDPRDSTVPVKVTENSEHQEIRLYANVISVANPLYHDSLKLGNKCYRIILDSGKILRRRESHKVYEI